MPRYFMGGTRLESFEKMMMDPSRSDSFPEEPQQCIPAKTELDGQPDKPFVPERRQDSV